MAKTVSPNLKIKTIFKPSAFVCLLALSLCSTPTYALPITPLSSTPSSEQSAQAIDAKISPFRTVSRPITIQVDLNNAPSSGSFVSSERTPLSHLIQLTEQQEQFLRQNEQQGSEDLARLEQEQDELEKIEQDRDQLLDNEEEEQLDQDPETVRRRQEESLGLWMTDVDFDTINQETSAHDCDDNGATKGSPFDLYAENFMEEANPEESRIQQQESPTEEEMLQWPIINLAQFEERQDEIQDEYEDLTE
ncbi:hypothetical protein BGX27_002891 [Mortierella sp. AM989]|nr:hypothetical protein BGX27_002891 [Mortierella sp. AM989]